ncbi:MAG TPA: helix-turn-helix transcriptional regulator [Gemmatimonadaceae bacterium]|nr:helix-turn-helix transcriptional regulator [Gemmatimonadaceae bacterium]
MKQQLVEMNVGHGPFAFGRVTLRGDAPHLVTTQQFDWPGLRVEAGINNIASVDEVAGLHHYLSLNLDDRPLTMEVKGEVGDFRRVVLRRGAAWVCPANEPVSVRLKETMGVAPHQYLLHLRLERSRRMLDAENASLADVAQRAGFADQAHFTRFFKREYGVTPGIVLKSRRRLTPVRE